MPDHPAWRSPLHAIRDRLSFAVDARPFRRAAFAVIDGLQHFHPSLQLDALFLAGTVMALQIGLDPHALVERAKRIMPDAEGPFDGADHIQAIRGYAQGELRK